MYLKNVMNSLVSYLGFHFYSDEKIKENENTPQQSDSYQTLSLETQKITAAIIENELNKKIITLSKTLRKGIAPIHVIAMKNPFLNQLIEGGNVFCSKAYVNYLCNLYVIHEVIEEAQQRLIEIKGGNFFVFPMLFRSEKILSDIKVWSIFNTTASLFASLNIHSSEFVQNVKSLSRPSTLKFVERIQLIKDGNILLIIGSLFALYGTLMSGGQFVKQGIEEGFRVRMDEVDDLLEEEDILLKKKFLEDIDMNKDPVSYAATLFSFDEDIDSFKDAWHKNLDEVGLSLEFASVNERKDFEEKLVEEANFAIQTILNSIEEMLSFLKNYKE